METKFNILILVFETVLIACVAVLADQKSFTSGKSREKKETEHTEKGQNIMTSASLCKSNQLQENFGECESDKKVDHDLPNANNPNWNAIDRTSESGAWNAADGRSPLPGPIGGWDDENDRGRQPGGNLGPDGDHRKWTIEDSIPGVPGQSYPAYVSVPETTFDCRSHKDPGYYGDVETRCQVFHICQIDGRHNSFLCPVGTVFDQKTLVCDWWFNVNCAETPNHYTVNANLYKEDGSIHSEWGARKGDSSGNWGNVAQPMPDGAVSWTMTDNHGGGSGAQNIPPKGSWGGFSATNRDQGSNSWGPPGGFGGNRLGGGGAPARTRSPFDEFNNRRNMKGSSTRQLRPGRFNTGNTIRRNFGNQKGGSRRWDESRWSSSNNKGGFRNANVRREQRHMKGNFGEMNAFPNRGNAFPSWDSSRNNMKGQNALDRRGEKGSAFQEEGHTQQFLGGRRQVSWTNSVNHGPATNLNKRDGRINQGLQNDDRRIQQDSFDKGSQLQGQGRASNPFPSIHDGEWRFSPDRGTQEVSSAWNGPQTNLLQWNDDRDRHRDNDYDY